MITDRIRDSKAIAQMLGETGFILRRTNCIDECQFLTDEDLQHAVCMALVIIGESANKLSDSFKVKHTYIPWYQIVGVRNIVAHGYWQLDMRQIWKAVIDDIPNLHTFLLSVEPNFLGKP